MRKRHTYADTDAIVLDYRIATHDAIALMGDAVESRTAPRLEIKILGTAPIAQLDADAAFGEGES